MQNLLEFIASTTANVYLVGIAFIVIFVVFWRVINAPGRVAVRESVTESLQTLKGFFAHPSHTWAEVVQPDLVNVGMDKFTSSVFGSIREIELPSQGDRINQGDKVWKVKRGERELLQVSPVSGRVVEVNKQVIKNPKLLNRENPEENWILKIMPIRLAREAKNLLSGEMLARWNQAVKEQLVSTLVPSSHPVLQEGGEIKPDLGDELTPEQWEKVARDFF